jgi:hypothetical protein
MKSGIPLGSFYFLQSILLSLASAMPIRTGESVWVKLRNGVWWPATVLGRNSSTDRGNEDDINPFVPAGKWENLFAARLKGLDDDHDSGTLYGERVISLCEDDKDSIWMEAGPDWLRSQPVPTHLDGYFKKALLQLPQVEQFDPSCKQSAPIEQVVAKGNDDHDLGISDDYVSRSASTMAAAAYSYDHEGVTPLKPDRADTVKGNAQGTDDDRLLNFFNSDSGVASGNGINGVSSSGSSCGSGSSSSSSSSSSGCSSVAIGGAPRVLKRQDAVTWDDYFMAVSFLSAMRSKDPSTQVHRLILL